MNKKIKRSIAVAFTATTTCGLVSPMNLFPDIGNKSVSLKRIYVQR